MIKESIRTVTDPLLLTRPSNASRVDTAGRWTLAITLKYRGGPRPLGRGGDNPLPTVRAAASARIKGRHITE